MTEIEKIMKSVNRNRSYYQQKTDANKIIDKMFANGEEEVKIIFKINTIFGFGAKIVRDRIELLRSMAL